MHIGLLILDGRGAVALFNTAAEQILGYRAREVRGKPAEEIFDGLTDLLAAAGRKPPDNRPEMQLNRNARHKDGRIIPLVVTPYLTPGDSSTRTDESNRRWTPMHADTARPFLRRGVIGVHRRESAVDAVRRGVVLVFQDARQLEKMENQLQHLDRLHSLDASWPEWQAAGIVHEIRNPLASISINAQHIVEEIKKYCRKFCTETGRADRFLSEINEEMQDILADVQSIESIVKRVLDFAHPNKPQVRACPIEDIVEEVLRFSKMPLRSQGIQLLTSFNTPARVRVDVSQMKQVLFNIVRNACDAMPQGGKLHVSTARAPATGSCHGSTELAEVNGHVRVEVEDTGRGIPEEYLERIFDPFFSMHARGTGLGLAISRKIVERHGGRIEVRSTPGKGTKFAVVLPTA